MNAQRILLPIDLRRCSLEVFSAANDLARHGSATVILLHVVELNIAAPEKGVYEHLGREACAHLQRLARHCLRPGVAAVVRVRFGSPAEEILAEARAGNSDLIILPLRLPSFWQRLFKAVAPRVVEKVVREAACGVFLAGTTSHFDCIRAWGHDVAEAGAVPDDDAGTPENETRGSRLNVSTDFTEATDRMHGCCL